jgi:hypothetical protein
MRRFSELLEGDTNLQYNLIATDLSKREAPLGVVATKIQYISKHHLLTLIITRSILLLL